MAKGINPFASKSGTVRPAKAPEEVLEPVPSGTAAEIMAWVDSDPDRAQRALDVEKSNLKRKTVIRDLEKVVSA